MRKIIAFATVLLLFSIPFIAQISELDNMRSWGDTSETPENTSVESGSFRRLELGPPDNTWIREIIPSKRVIPYPYLREADVIWAKRV